MLSIPKYVTHMTSCYVIRNKADTIITKDEIYFNPSTQSD